MVFPSLFVITDVSIALAPVRVGIGEAKGRCKPSVDPQHTCQSRESLAEAVLSANAAVE